MAEPSPEFGSRRPLAVTECPLTQAEENAGLLLDYCNRTLEPELRAAFEQHLAVCAACRAFADSQTAVWNALDAFEALPVTDDFDRRLWARIEQQERAPWWSRAWDWMTAGGTARWRPLAPVAAALLLAVGLYWDGRWPGAAAPVTVAGKAAETVDLDQVETTLEDVEMLRQLGVTEPAAQQSM